MIEVRGEIIEIIYKNETNGYTICNILVFDMENGDFSSWSPEQVEKYKEQFNEDSIKKTQLRWNAQKLAHAIFYRKR